MKLLRAGSTLGESPYYLARRGDAHASSIRNVLDALEPDVPDARAIDPVGLRHYFDRTPDGERTCFRAVKLLPAGCDLMRDDATLQVRDRALPDATGSLLNLLERVIADQLGRARRPVVALSGGLDSALVLALVRRLTGDAIPVVTLATEFPNYCEREPTLATARALGASSIEVILAGVNDFLAALPEAIAACETPLFNLHPVSKLLLARAVAQRGHDAILTGDGADQVFAGADARNYLPIVGSLVRATGLSLLSPFLDERVVGWAKTQEIDPDKTALRRAASTILPAEIAWRRKTARIAPDFDLTMHRDAGFERHLAPTIDRCAPARGGGAEQTLWATTSILLRALGGPC